MRLDEWMFRFFIDLMIVLQQTVSVFDDAVRFAAVFYHARQTLIVKA